LSFDSAADELELLDAAVPENVRAVYERVDRDCDGQLTRSELIRGLRHDQELQELLELSSKVGWGNSVLEAVFQGMDRDGDRATSLQEFSALLRRAHSAAKEEGGAANRQSSLSLRTASLGEITLTTPKKRSARCVQHACTLLVSYSPWCSAYAHNGFIQLY
jgi:hypothetical protein